jgi:hypothetical protein
MRSGISLSDRNRDVVYSMNWLFGHERYEVTRKLEKKTAK